MSRKNSRRRIKTASGFKVNELPPELRASVARKMVQTEQRSDTQLAMRRITSSGWTYQNERALAEGTDDVGYYIDETKHPRITPEDAFDLYNHHNYDHNRSFDQQHATHLSKAMRVAPNIDIAIGPSGKPVVVNGQHQLWAIFMKGVTITASVTVYQCRDEASIARLFTIFDANRKRSQQNAIAAAKGAGDLDCDVPANKLARWSQCVATAEADFRRQTVSETNWEKMERVHRPEVQGFATWIEELVSDRKTKLLITQGVGAAFYAMYRSDPIKGEEFIRKYIQGTNLGETSPVLKLREKMLDRPEGQHDASVCRNHAELTFVAWRKFCLGEPMQICRAVSNIPHYDKWKIYIAPPPVQSTDSPPDGTVLDIDSRGVKVKVGKK